MSEMKYCQGTKCHEYKTKDRIRGHKGDKHYETRRNRHFYNGEFCSVMCRDDWYNEFGKRAIDHFGRIHEPKRQDASGAWYKDYKYNYNNGSNSNYDHYFINDLLGQRISITQQQYDDTNLTTPTTS
jgi:hypothetical protein